MRVSRSLSLFVALAALSVFAPTPAPAQSLHTYSVSLLGGLGGSFDVDPDAGLDNSSFQLGFSLVTSGRNSFTARLGQIDFSGAEGFGSLGTSDLTYLTLGGEYRNSKAFYDSGLYIALGGYRIEGDAGGADTAIGLAVGSTADFPINRWVSILAELSGHATDLDDAQFFGMLHLGVSVHF